VLTAVYIVICFTWALINSEWFPHGFCMTRTLGRGRGFYMHGAHLVSFVHSDLDHGCAIRSPLLCQYCWEYSHDTIPSHRGFGNEEQHYFS
jgi:hypothetical protein